MTFISYAQNYEDVMLWRALKHIDKGFYVDVGANHPTEDSVTKAFYDRGWQGINIEPVSQWFKLLQKERPRDINLQIAATNFTGNLSFFEVIDTGLSTTNLKFAQQHAEKGGYKISNYGVPCEKITQICYDHRVDEIHFLKIDVEGCEQAVLEGIDFSVIRPWIVLVEATLPSTQIKDHETWEGFILAASYSYVYFDGVNRFYVADEHPELKQAFEAPPNCWDGFITSREAILHHKVQELHSSFLGKEADYNRKEADYNRKEADYNHVMQHFNIMMNSRSMRATEPLRVIGRRARQIKRLILGATLASPKKSLQSFLRRMGVSIVSFVLTKPALKKMVKRVANYFPFLLDYPRRLLLAKSAVSRRSRRGSGNTELSPLVSKVLLDLKASIKHTD
jgi:FkbM family methyltransferase